MADPAPRARPAGLSSGSRADDQRLRRVAQGFLARFRHHCRRADQTDRHLRDEHRVVGPAGRSLRRDLPCHVPSALAPGPETRTPLEHCLVTDLLRVEELRLSRAGREVLRGISVRVTRGELCALMGLSGSGKTTVLRATVALEGFQAGRIEVDGFSLVPGPVPPESRLKPLRQRVGVGFSGDALFEHLSALEHEGLAPAQLLRRARGEAKARARQLLDSLGVANRAEAYPRELSGGAAQGGAIARVLAR